MENMDPCLLLLLIKNRDLRTVLRCRFLLNNLGELGHLSPAAASYVDVQKLTYSIS